MTTDEVLLNRSPVAADVEIVAGDVRDRNSVSRGMRVMMRLSRLAALIGIPYS